MEKLNLTLKFEQRLSYDGRNGKISEEFVETKYYDDLNCVDKQHHTVTLYSIDQSIRLICSLTKKLNFDLRQEQDSSKWRMEIAKASDSQQILQLPIAAMALVGVIRRRTTGFRPVIIW